LQIQHTAGSGEPRLVAFAVDITTRVEVEASLRCSEARYRAIVEDQTEMVCRFLPDCTLTFVNEAYCRYFRKDYNELIGTTFLSLLPETDRQPLLDHLATLSTEKPEGMTEHPVLHEDGKEHWQQWTDRVILDETGKIIEFQSVGRDITARKLAELDREHLVDELRRTLEKVHHLTGLLPICSGCKKIRDDEGYWHQVEQYISVHSDASFTHSLCPDCVHHFFPGMEGKD
jgi:PAS domain S-box-containing protein